jgi:hypothetical protein
VLYGRRLRYTHDLDGNRLTELTITTVVDRTDQR